MEKWKFKEVVTGYEDAVREALQQRIESLGMQDLIFDVIDGLYRKLDG